MSTPNELTVPLGSGPQKRLVSPADADPDTVYTCPNCDAPLTLKKGTVRVAHFAHARNTSCTNETILHAIAKMLIVAVIEGWKRGEHESPNIKCVCDLCGHDHERPLPERITHAVDEKGVPSSFRPDVVLYEGEKPIGGVEIWVCHRVPKEKWDKIQLPLIELKGSDVLAHPHTWNPSDPEYLREIRCTSCIEILDAFRSKSHKLARQMGIELPKHYYRYAPYECRRCHREFLVFTWPGVSAYYSSRPAINPRPPNVRWVKSTALGRSYSGNVCPSCDIIQGRYPLHGEPDSPFYRVENEDDAGSFERDIERIAIIWDYRTGLSLERKERP